MPMTQIDIRRHYETEWKQRNDTDALDYSNPVEDALLYPAYERLIADLNLCVNGGRVLDVGCGSGRWIGWFLAKFQPTVLHGVDYTAASIDLLHRWRQSARVGPVEIDFRQADITNASHGIDGSYDLINIANVLFHIPETDLYRQALRNMSGLLTENGRIVTTEYLPRCTMRTEWMLVRSRYEFEALVQETGLAVVAVRPFCIFSNDPMGLDGPDAAVRSHFHRVRSTVQGLMASETGKANRAFFTDFFAEVERAVLAFCDERVSPVDLPSQKLVVLRRA
jgi:SAM-dependent methyltransferase